MLRQRLSSKAKLEINLNKNVQEVDRNGEYAKVQLFRTGLIATKRKNREQCCWGMD